jgi:serine protease
VRFTKLVAVCGLMAATVAMPMFTAPASAYTDSGHIWLPAPIGNGATDLEFSLTGCVTPKTQGVHGWTFNLPASVATAGTVVGVTGSDATGLYDLSAYVYDAGCNYTRTVSYAGQDLYVTLAAGEKYLSVFTTNGANVSVFLTAPTTLPSTSGPNDPLFTQNGAGDLLLAGQWNMRKVNAPQAWGVSTGSGIKVADLDSGLDLGHPDFNCTNKVEVVSGSDLIDNDSTPQDMNGHGTHTAGIIGACTNNGIGVAGTAPDATIMPIRVLDAAGSGTAQELVDGINLAVAQGAHVINMSIGFSIGGAPGTGGALGFLGFWPEIDAAISNAVANGVVVVASSGNDSSPICGYPAIAYNVICVGASDPQDMRSAYSAFPVKDDPNDLVGPGMLAPGGRGVIVFCDFSASEIISTYDRAVDAAEGDCDTNPGYASITGTSMAAPMVSGAAALVYSKLIAGGATKSAATAKDVIEALTKSAHDVYTPGYDPISGYGRLDAEAAVNYWP